MEDILFDRTTQRAPMSTTMAIANQMEVLMARTLYHAHFPVTTTLSRQPNHPPISTFATSRRGRSAMTIDMLSIVERKQFVVDSSRSPKRLVADLRMTP